MNDKIENEIKKNLKNNENIENQNIETNEDEKSEAVNNLNELLISQLKSKNEELTSQLEKTTKQMNDIKNSYVRLLADFENLKKRTKKEVQDIRKYATTSLLKDFLPIIDNMQRALEHSDLDDANPDDPLIEGIKLVYRQFVSTLEKYSVKSFESVNTPFDPIKHEALQMMETEEFEDNIVMTEYEKGYFIGERLLRPAKVIVAKNVSK